MRHQSPHERGEDMVGYAKTIVEKYVVVGDFDSEVSFVLSPSCKSFYIYPDSSHFSFVEPFKTKY